MHTASDEHSIREAARRVLRDFWVEQPAHIDLEALAWRSGLTVVCGGLEHAEGRLVAGGEHGRGFIRVRDGIQSVGRRRFIVAHELGHFHLHKRQSYTDTCRELSSYDGGDIESEANVFAAELLMPDYLFAPLVRHERPSHAGMQKLATVFATSQLATVMQFLTCTAAACALVYSREGRALWARTSSSWSGNIQTGPLPPGSAAAAFFATGCTPRADMQPVNVSAWQMDGAAASALYEDTLLWPEQRVSLSLLWQT